MSSTSFAPVVGSYRERIELAEQTLLEDHGIRFTFDLDECCDTHALLALREWYPQDEAYAYQLSSQGWWIHWSPDGRPLECDGVSYEEDFAIGYTGGAEVGARIQAVLEQAGFAVEWSGDASDKLMLSPRSLDGVPLDPVSVEGIDCDHPYA